MARGAVSEGRLSNRAAYAASGQVTGDTRGSEVYAYNLNARGRVKTVTRGGSTIATYTYDSDGQRIVKTADGTTTHYHYDNEGRLISETDGSSGEVIRDYFWLGLTLVAVVQMPANDNLCTGGTLPDPVTRQCQDLLGPISVGSEAQEPELFYLHAVHLGRPKFATNQAGDIVWDGGIVTPFGIALNTMGAFTQNLMFPGQYADAETDLSHNWQRTYDPTLGHYLQSDPIGLGGGINRYAYVGGNPVSFVDPEGKFGIVVGLIGEGTNVSMQLAINGGR